MTRSFSLEEKNKYLAFEINQTTYCIGLSNVKEIMEYMTVDPIPMTPDYIIGAINLRGEIIPVFDLSIRLGKPSQALTSRTCIIIAESEFDGIAITLGLKVDIVSRVLDIAATDIDNVPDLAGQFRSPFVQGLAKIEKSLITILDIRRLLTLTELTKLEEIKHHHQLCLELPVNESGINPTLISNK